MKKPPKVKNREIASELESPPATTIPQYRRDIFPRNLVLSASDLHDFSELIFKINEKAINLEISSIVKSNPEDEEKNKETIKSLMKVEYNYTSSNGNSVQGLGVQNNDKEFPEHLKSFFISNASYAKAVAGQKPKNTVEVFIVFEKPSLKIDLITLPSNPTENNSIINVDGRDEDWVITTAEKINKFFEKRRSIRPIIHDSGTYDYFTYIMYLPLIIWFFLKLEESYYLEFLKEKSIFLNVIVGIYALLFSLLLARFIFQYIRWLFPPMEYYKNSRFGAYIHRVIAGALIIPILISVLYDIVKWIFLPLFK